VYNPIILLYTKNKHWLWNRYQV